MFIDCLLYVGVTTSGKGGSHYLSFTHEETEVLRAESPAPNHTVSDNIEFYLFFTHPSW